jgi:hypothetical protein
MLLILCCGAVLVFIMGFLVGYTCRSSKTGKKSKQMFHTPSSFTPLPQYTNSLVYPTAATTTRRSMSGDALIPHRIAENNGISGGTVPTAIYSANYATTAAATTTTRSSPLITTSPGVFQVPFVAQQQQQQQTYGRSSSVQYGDTVGALANVNGFNV